MSSTQIQNSNQQNETKKEEKKDIDISRLIHLLNNNNNIGDAPEDKMSQLLML